MRAFLLGVVFSIGLAVIAGIVMPVFFSRPADQAFSTPSARVDGSLEDRNFSGERSR